MAHINKVLQSFNVDGGNRCVDVFVRPDGTFGFEEYRRDIEDALGWFPVGFFSDQTFGTEQAALNGARAAVVWLGDEGAA